MKKSIVLILSVVMLFAAAPMRAFAVPTVCPFCGNPDLSITLTDWEVVSGYTHPYTTEHGLPSGCTVHIFKEYYYQGCSKCPYVEKVYTGNSYEQHSKPFHK